MGGQIMGANLLFYVKQQILGLLGINDAGDVLTINDEGDRLKF